jgi:hypothetical protein
MKDWKKKLFEKRLSEITLEKEKMLKMPTITDQMADEIMVKIQEMFKTTKSAELKLALAHFIEKIDISGRELNIHYSFAPASKGIVPVGSDPST